MQKKSQEQIERARQLQQFEFHRNTDEAENSYLQKIAKKDAYAHLKQWLFPALALSLLVLAYWLYRTSLQELLQGTKNPREFRVFIGIVLNFFVLLLHLALILYVIKLLQTLKHFGKYSISSMSPMSQDSAASHAIYAVEGVPDYDLSLIFTSRAGLRRYRCHYYLSELPIAPLPITPLPAQRKVFPLFVQKKSWTNFAESSKEELEKVFPEQQWFVLCKEFCKAKLRLHVVKVQYYDFQFYYLCAIGLASGQKDTNANERLRPLLAKLAKLGIPNSSENYNLLDLPS